VRQASAGLLLIAAAAASCGKEGPPLPPLRPEPGHIREVAASRSATLIRIRMEIPSANFDGTTPPVMERIEVYATTTTSGVPAPGATELFNQKFLYKVIPVRRDEEGKPVDPAMAAKSPAPGETYVFQDLVDGTSLNPAEKPIRHYLVAAATGRSRRGRPSPILSVPLAQEPLPPAKPSATYDERTFTLTWEAPAGQTFVVSELAKLASITPATPLTKEPLTAPKFETPVWFGRERCFIIMPIAITGRVSIEGTPGGPFCHAPVDTFAPAAPTGLLAVQDERGIVLRWTGIDAGDLAGYLVLRSAGAGETLQQLFRTPIAETTYVDQAITAGVTYTYAIIAVDRAGNVSPQSGRQQVTARRP
jgi:hypothetical protein